MNRIIVIAVVLMTVLAAPLWAQPAAPAETSGKISVTGTMVTQVPPDIVVWSINLTSRGATLKEAKAASDLSMSRALDATKELSVAPADIQTSQLNAYREGGRDFWGNPVNKGWSVCRSITVKQRDLARFDELFTKLVDAADVEVNFRFESSKYHELRRETRIRAAEAAKEKAEAMVKALGAALGPPISVEEGVSPVAMPGHGAFGPQIIDPKSNGAITFDWPAADPAGDGAATGTLAPGMTEIRETVSVTFKIQ
jgi:uncharacterized protein YggE